MEMITVRNDNSWFPFTSNQWQQFEHQALVYKYIISGIPIPPNLLFSINKTNLDSSTQLILHRQSPHQSIGWEYFQMGLVRKIKIDTEPGRCRRTDGKKWRCSKEAFRDSKYCERHMHRGRNRSRKPVEATLSTNSASSSSSSSSSSICTKFPKYVHPQFSSSRSSGNVLSSQDRFLLESSPYYSHSEKDLSYSRKDVDEHPFLSESCSGGTISASVSDSWLLEPLVVNNSSSSLVQSKQQCVSDYQNDYSYLQLQNSPIRQKQDEGKDEAHKVMHHFFDESPHHDNDDHNKDKDSFSIPSCGHDFFLTHNDK